MKFEMGIFGEIRIGQLAALECRRVCRRRRGTLHVRIRERRELRDELQPPFARSRPQFARVIRKKLKRRRAARLLALEQHRCRGAQQQERRERAQLGRRANRREPAAEAAVGDLVVVFQIGDQRAARQAGRAPASRFFLPCEILALIEKTRAHERDEFLRGAAITAHVRFVMSGQRNPRRVMKVVVPQRADSGAARLRRLQKARILRFVFRHDQKRFFRRRRGPPA